MEIEITANIAFMNSSTYIPLAQHTSSTAAASELCKLEHGIIGISTEAGELLDIVKKNKFYDKPVDWVNVKEEIGDILWYCAEICAIHKWTFEEIMEQNIRKLKARYPDRFTNANALNRNLDKERSMLEKGNNE